MTEIYKWIEDMSSCNNEILVRKLSIKLFKVGRKNETCNKDTFRDGEVRLVWTHATINVKTISGGTFCFFLLYLLAKKKMSNNELRIHKLSSTNETTF